MTVQELITYLQTLDPTMYIYVQSDYQGLDTLREEDIEISHIDTVQQGFGIFIDRTNDTSKPKAIIF